MDKKEKTGSGAPGPGDIQFEEINDIPEHISPGMDIIEEGEKPDHQKIAKGTLDDEIAIIGEDIAESVVISDDYSGTDVRVHKENKNTADVLDLGNLAAEVDSLIRVRKLDQSPVKKESVQQAAPPGTQSIRPEVKKSESPETAANENIIVVSEDEEIDLDYYSLEELEIPRPKGDAGEFQPAGLEAGLTDIEAPMPETPGARESEYTPKPDLDLDARMLEEVVDPGKPAAAGIAESPDDYLKIQIPENLKEKLPDDFSLDTLGPIDLKEAEAISNEKIVLLTEEDLIEELEDTDLVPVAGNAGKKKLQSTDLPKVKKNIEKNEAATDRDAETVKPSGIAVHEKKSEREEIKAAAEPVPEIRLEDHGGDLIVQKEHGERVLEMPFEPTEAVAAPVDTEEKNTESREAVKGEVILDDRDSVSEIVFIDDDIEPPVVAQARDAQKAAEKEPASDTDAGRTNVQREPAVKPEKEVAGRIEVRPSTRPDIPLKTPVIPAGPVYRESIPADLIKADSIDNLHIIDDDLVERKQDAGEVIFKEDELDKITSEIVDVIEGEARLLPEADAADDMDKIAGIMRGTTPAFEDLLIDLEGEYSFRDDEINIIDNAFLIEDYGRYLNEIDNYTESRDLKKSSRSIELLGLDQREMSDFEGNIFDREYEKIKLEEVSGATRPGYDQPPSDMSILKKCSYMQASRDSLSGEEKRSIEEDINSDYALVFEEDVREITEKLKEIKGRRSPKPEEQIADISNNVVILENESDVEKFIAALPGDKHENLKKLLKYLDGLFERLPEDVIRNFADSEYFQLYSRVLNDLGV